MEMIQLTTSNFKRQILINPEHIISVEEYLVNVGKEDLCYGSKIRFSGNQYIEHVSETMDVVLEKLNKRID